VRFLLKGPYHPGEIEVQERAGVREGADRIGRSIHSTIPPIAREFLRSQPMVVLGTADADGRPWASLLTGEPGFLRAVDERTVRIDARPAPSDPATLGGSAGLLVIDFGTRRRMRLNGTIEELENGAILVRAREVYSNCPKYIQVRTWERRVQNRPDGIRRGKALTEKQREWIRAADTFFIATSHPEAGADVSHRGGNPGFVSVVSDGLLAWPDYPGNMMFQTLGNIASNPRAGLLFLDFDSGGTLHLTGAARTVWGPERRVELEIDEVLEIGRATPLRFR
jgi:predicted pyridoxine 5'-phosphate oxidase superfamily flavin-nucleotide-binding protein